MVKQKRRYLLVEILFDDSNSRITESDVYHAVFDQIAMLHGDYGIGAIKSSFQVKVCDTSTNVVVLRTSVSGLPMVTSALPFVVCISTSACVLRLMFEGSSMRTVERFLIKDNLKSLYARLRTATAPAEKARIQEAILSVTGSKVSHVRM